VAHEVFTRAGYVHIGMDHFARRDDELAIAQAEGRLGRNFQGYTVKAAPDTVAFGVTGIGDVGGAYVQTLRPLPKYYQAVKAGQFATERGCVLDNDDRLRRDVIAQVMCHFRVDLDAAAAAHGERRGYFAAELEDLQRLSQDGLVRLDGPVVTVTELGRLLVRNVAMVFDAYLRRAAQPRLFSRTV
jgi:oxygen-independent coproporphyrinogen-3 oxidase